MKFTWEKVRALRVQWHLPLPITPIMRKHCVLQKLLGSGGNSLVYQAKDMRTGRDVAAKLLRTDKLEYHFNTQRKIKLHRKFGHENITACHNSFLCSERPESIVLIMELATHGDLIKFASRKSILSEDEAMVIFVQLFEGIKYIVLVRSRIGY